MWGVNMCFLDIKIANMLVIGEAVFIQLQYFSTVLQCKRDARWMCLNVALESHILAHDIAFYNFALKLKG